MTGSIAIVLPHAIQNVFSHLNTVSKEHYLHGSAVFDLIFQMKNQDSIVPACFQFITNSNNQKLFTSAGFKQCKGNNDLYFKDMPCGRIELLSVQGNLLQFMSNNVFTINTLFCKYKEDKALIYDLTGKGLHDLDQMRLVMNVDPNEHFMKDPASILFCMISCFKGFHLELNIMHALDNLKHLGKFDRQDFDAIAKTHLSAMDYAGRVKYTRLFIQYNLLGKLFNIKYEGKLEKCIAELEKFLNVNSISLNKNNNRLFVGNKLQTISSNSLIASEKQRRNCKKINN